MKTEKTKLIPHRDFKRELKKHLSGRAIRGLMVASPQKGVKVLTIVAIDSKLQKLLKQIQAYGLWNAPGPTPGDKLPHDPEYIKRPPSTAFQSAIRHMKKRKGAGRKWTRKQRQKFLLTLARKARESSV